MLKYLNSISLAILFSIYASAANIVTIRDSEIEIYLREITNPLLQNAGIDPSSVQIHIVQDNSINAFVYDGLQIFVNTGLIKESQDPDMLRGVLAHEIGHIQGAHLIKGNIKTSAEMTQYIAMNLAILGAALASGGLQQSGAYGGNATADALMAAVLANNQIAERNILSFSRSQEAEADRYALLSMEKSHMDPAGLVRLFTKLQSMHDKLSGKIDRYSITHPLTQDRIQYFDTAPKFTVVPASRSVVAKHEMIRAKIFGYIDQNTKPDLHSKKAVMYYETFKALKKKDYKLADKHAKKLLELEPKNPFFHEVMGQVESGIGNIPAMKEQYKIAISLVNPDYTSPMEMEFAYAMLSQNPAQSDVESAIMILNRIRLTEPNNVHIYKELMKAYKILGESTMARLVEIEEDVITHQKEQSEKKVLLKELDEMRKKSYQRSDIIGRIEYLKSLLK